jgi:hypothetical protein
MPAAMQHVTTGVSCPTSGSIPERADWLAALDDFRNWLIREAA